MRTTGESMEEFNKRRIAGLFGIGRLGPESGVSLAGSALPQPTTITPSPPKYWAVTGVASNDVSNMRDVPDGDSKKLGAIPPNAHGIKNIGCMTPTPSLDRWMVMTPAEKANSKLEWCRIEYNGKQGCGRALPEARWRQRCRQCWCERRHWRALKLQNLRRTSSHGPTGVFAGPHSACRVQCAVSRPVDRLPPSAINP